MSHKAWIVIFVFFCQTAFSEAPPLLPVVDEELPVLTLDDEIDEAERRAHLWPDQFSSILLQNSNDLIECEEARGRSPKGYPCSELSEVSTYFRWNPATGASKKLFSLGQGYQLNLAIESKAGIFILFTKTSPNNYLPKKAQAYSPPSREHKNYAALISINGKFAVASLQMVGRNNIRLVELADHSFLLAGGRTWNGNERTRAVERVLYTGDQLKSELLPDLPGKGIHSYTLLALADGRAMLIGGSSSQYAACHGTEDCIADTHFLDVNAKKWEAGPRLNEGRAAASATLLLDGSVLVAGGWTPADNWSSGESRTVEHWVPGTSSFSSAQAMAVGMAEHGAVWAPGLEGKELLLAGGSVAAIQAYDVVKNNWRLVGEYCGESENNKSTPFFPFQQEQQWYVWINGSNQFCHDLSTPDTKEPALQYYEWHRQQLRLPPPSPELHEKIDINAGKAFFRLEAGFFPGDDRAPSLMVGGSADSGNNVTGAVDVIWPDGSIQSLFALNHARSAPQVFRLTDGSYLVAGGADGKRNDSNNERPVLPMEWLSAKPDLGSAQWSVLEGTGIANATYGQSRDGLIALLPDGKVERLSLTSGGNEKPIFKHISLPSLNHARTREHVIIKELTDGRVIIAGGERQKQKIAILRDDAMNADAIDEYVGIGSYAPARDYEIYDPQKKNWTSSVSSRNGGAVSAVFDDGRIVKIGVETTSQTENNDRAKPQNSKKSEHSLEISRADGGAWTALDAVALPLVDLSEAQLFIIYDELFISGDCASKNCPDTHRLLQWFNTEEKRWDTVWEAEKNDNSRDNEGRVIFRHLANGKQLLLPLRMF